MIKTGNSALALCGTEVDDDRIKTITHPLIKHIKLYGNFKDRQSPFQDGIFAVPVVSGPYSVSLSCSHVFVTEKINSDAREKVDKLVSLSEWKLFLYIRFGKVSSQYSFLFLASVLFASHPELLIKSERRQ